MKLLVLVLFTTLVISLVKASPYNKYGRTCRDISCIVGQEECVMEQDACTGYSQACGSYPTCKRKAGAQKKGCASIRCDPGHFCSIRQENCSRPPCEIKPVCIAFRTTSQSASSVQSKPSYNNYNNYNSFGGLSKSSNTGLYSQQGQGSQGQRTRTTWSWSSLG